MSLKTPADASGCCREAAVGGMRAQAGVHIFILVPFAMEPFCRGDSDRLKAANSLASVESLLTVRKN